MRLIDADKLESVDFYDCIDSMEIMNVIDEQPTAYDVDVVVARLELKLDNAEYDSLLTSNEKDAYVDAYRRAIEIVKGGGV